MKLNLGCGRDCRVGYVNVDFVQPCDQLVDLSNVPWPWPDGSVEEVLMLDFLEHFPYRATEKILNEVWRILKPDGTVEIQVPDFRHCAYAVLDETELGFQCNRCGWWFEPGRSDTTKDCMKCGQSLADIQDAAIHRLMGGQDKPGNWHFTMFTDDVLQRMLEKNGFVRVDSLEMEHQQANWNVKLRAHKDENGLWGTNE